MPKFYFLYKLQNPSLNSAHKMENIGNQSFMHHQEKIIRLGRSRSPERLNFTGTAHFNGNANGIILNNDSKIILNNTNSNSNSNLKLNWKGTHTRTPSFRNSVQVQPFQDLNNNYNPSLNANSHAAVQNQSHLGQKMSHVASSPRFYSIQLDAGHLAKQKQKQNQFLTQHVHPHVSVGPQKQQLLRKVKSLQNRITQLHEQKNRILLKSHQDCKKLFQQNNYLKSKYNQLQHKYNIMLNGNGLTNPTRFDQLAKSHKPVLYKNGNNQINYNRNLKNKAYYQENEDATSICFDNSKIQINGNHNVDLNNLSNMNSTVNNLTKVVQQKQQQLQSLQNELKKIKHLYQISKQNNQDYVRRILSKQQNNLQVEPLKNQLKKTKHLYQLSKLNSQDYVRRILSKQQQVMKLQADYLNRINNLNKIIKINQNKCTIAEDRIKTLEAQIQKFSTNYGGVSAGISVKGGTNQRCASKQKQGKKQGQGFLGHASGQGSRQCIKCRQLVKTLVKLNQKVGTKTF